MSFSFLTSILLSFVLFQSPGRSQPLKPFQVKWFYASGSTIPHIRLTLSDGKPRLFIFDTGAPAMMIDRSVASQLNLPVQSYLLADRVQKADYIVSSVDIGPGSLKVPQLPFILSDFSILRKFDPLVAGIFGLNVMQSFAVGMNYSDQTIEFIQEKLSDIKAEPKNAYRFPLIKIDNYFFVDAMVNNKPVRFCIDTGAHNSSISSQDLKVIGKPTAMLNGMQEISSAEDGKSFTGANARMLRFRNLTMGELKWKEPVFQNTISEQSTEISSLGNDFFRQFHVMIDFPMKTLYLTPDPAYKSPEQDWIGVGTEWYLNEGKVLIGRVYSPSPAQKAGLKIGDEVINLGGKVLKGLSYSEVTELFNARKKIGETVEMEILQKGSSSARKIKLQITKLL